MIERLDACLQAMSGLTPEELEAPEAESLRRDCADALRLELDCRQLELAIPEREALAELSDRLETTPVRGAAVAAAVRRTVELLPGRSRNRAP